MKKNAGYVGNILGIVFTALQDNLILQIISIVLTTASTLFSICFTIYQWYKNAKDDGKITKDEVDELANKLNKFKEENKK